MSNDLLRSRRAVTSIVGCMQPTRTLVSLAAPIVGAALLLGTVAAFPGSVHAADVVAQSPTSGTVPAGICFADVAANGGSGYDANPGPVAPRSGLPGFGASLTARFAVSAGESYSITFAKGGAAGPDLGAANTGGAGGDAAAVAFSGVVHLAAGGGGGAGGISTITIDQMGTLAGSAGLYPSGTGLIPGEFGMNALFPDSLRPNAGQGGKDTGAGGQGHADASPGQNGTSAPGAIGAGGAGGAGDPGTLVTPVGPGGGGGGAGYNTGAGGGGGANNAADGAFDSNFAGSGGGGNSFIDHSALSYAGGFVGYFTHTASASITWVACPQPSTTTSSTTTTSTTTTVVTVPVDSLPEDTTPADTKPVDSTPVDSTPVDSQPADSSSTTLVAGEPAPSTTAVGSGGNGGGGGPRSLPTTGSTSGALVVWSSIILLLGAVLMTRSRRPI